MHSRNLTRHLTHSFFFILFPTLPIYPQTLSSVSSVVFDHKYQSNRTEYSISISKNNPATTQTSGNRPIVSLARILTAPTVRKEVGIPMIIIIMNRIVAVVHGG